MKIYCSRTELNKALNNVSHSVPVRTTSNILEGILINVEEGKMFLTATDTNMTTETVINVNSEGTCEFVVPAKLFSAIISKLPEDEMMIDYINEKSKINIKCAGSSSEIICFRGDEYPKLFIDEGENEIFLDKEDVKKLIKKTRFQKYFRLALHGWMEYHIAAMECSTNSFLSNPAGKGARKILEQNLGSGKKSKGE